MTERWAARLPLREAAAAGRLRLEIGVQVLVVGDILLLSGEHPEEELHKKLLVLAAEDRFTVQNDRQLVREGELVPQGYLPEGNWQPLQKWLQVELGSAGIAGKRQIASSARLIALNSIWEKACSIAARPSTVARPRRLRSLGGTSSGRTGRPGRDCAALSAAWASSVTCPA